MSEDRSQDDIVTRNTPPYVPISPRTAVGERPCDWIGPYKLIEIIGEGGFGVVWLAERREPMVQRVALKIIKPGMDSKAVIGRFEQERQALAVMDHPNVARVLDGGVTPAGRPYFVMEHVRGEPVTRYCDHHRLTIRQRLELFIPVCEAVQHAHMKGIIHRDLKPSNVLVAAIDGTPVVKVIDFGIAKATDASEVQNAVFSMEGQIIGTPEYMSPEQASGLLDVDTRSDVYSLGVLLYEMLVGRLPFEPALLRKRGMEEIRRIIRDEEPPRPSNKLKAPEVRGAELADSRRHSLASLIHELRSELEWIPLKAMRKERERRYESAGAMAADVRKYLNDVPLDAAPESRWYVIRKFVRRRRGLAFSAAAITAILVFASIGIAVFAWRAEVQRIRADRRLQQVEKMARFQQASLEGVTPELVGRELLKALTAETGGSAARRGLQVAEAERSKADITNAMHPLDVPGIATSTLVSSVFAPMEARARKDFADDSTVLVSVLQSLANVYQSLGARERAFEIQKEVVDLRLSGLGASHVETIRALNTAASMRRIIGDMDTAREYAEKAYNAALPLGSESPELLEAMHWLGSSLAASDAARAEDLLKTSLQIRRKTLGANDEKTIWSMLALVTLYQNSNRSGEAEDLVQEAIAASEATLGPNHETTLYALRYVRRQYERTSRLPQALEVGKVMLARRDEVLGPLHPSSIVEIGSVARLHLANGDPQSALPFAEEHLRRSLERLGSDNIMSRQAEQLVATIHKRIERQNR